MNPTPAAPPAPAAATAASGGVAPTEPLASPAEAGFAPLLAAAQGPPGGEPSPITRTAHAGGEPAGSDSSEPDAEAEPGIPAAGGRSVAAAVPLSGRRAAAGQKGSPGPAVPSDTGEGGTVKGATDAEAPASPPPASPQLAGVLGEPQYTVAAAEGGRRSADAKDATRSEASAAPATTANTRGGPVAPGAEAEVATPPLRTEPAGQGAATTAAAGAQQAGAALSDAVLSDAAGATPSLNAETSPRVNVAGKPGQRVLADGGPAAAASAPRAGAVATAVQGGAARVSAPLPDTAAAGSGEQASPVGLRAASLAAAKVAGSASESESAAPAGATGGARPGPGEPAHQIAAQPVSSPLANAAATTAAAPLERSDQSLPGTLSAQAHPAELRAQILRSVPSESREMRLEGTAAGRTPGTGGGAAAQSTGGMSPAAGGDTRRSRDEAGEAEQPARLAPAVEESTPSQNSGGSDAFKLGQVAAGGSGRAGAASPEPTRLADLAEAAEAAIHVNAQAGVSAARITLQPQELGGVEIRLSYQSGGVSATIHADSSQAAQTLQQAIPDLRRALEGHGLSLLSLDVHDRSGSSANGEPSPRQQGGGQAAGAVNDELEETAPNSPDLSTVSALGSRIDVFA